VACSRQRKKIMAELTEEEFDELKAEVHSNSDDRDVISELADIAVATIFGIAGIQEGATKCL
jgi:hypothetical protein